MKAKAYGETGSMITWPPLGPPHKRCQWIDGEPTADDRCKCSRRVKTGSSYCPAHHKRAWRSHVRKQALAA